MNQALPHPNSFTTAQRRKRWAEAKAGPLKRMLEVSFSMAGDFSENRPRAELRKIVRARTRAICPHCGAVIHSKSCIL